MRVVTRRTGLKADLIRAWERRHAAISPDRNEGNRRLYSEEEIQRLLLIRRAIEAGFHIGNLASLPDAEIERLIGDSGVVPMRPAGSSQDRIQSYVAECLQSIIELDGESLRRKLDAASVDLSRVELMDKMLVPLMQQVGEACVDGRCRVANEHLASTVTRSFLDSIRAAYPASVTAPAIVVTTPAMQHHELAGMVVAATARAEGWRTTFLGSNLPVEDIAAAVRQVGASAVALSITIADGDPQLAKDLRRLRRLIPDDVELIVGGQGADGYRNALDDVGARCPEDLEQFRRLLGELASVPRDEAPRDR